MNRRTFLFLSFVLGLRPGAAAVSATGRAWIKHNIEEVGNFEAFLPQLYSLK